MGGGKSETPKTYSPQEQAQAQIQIDNANAERQAAAAERERQRVAAEKAAQVARTQGLIQQQYSGGQNYGRSKIDNLGYNDQYGLLDRYNNLLNSARNAVPEDATNPATYFDYDSIWNKAQNEAQAAQQAKLDNQFRNMTKPDWQKNYIADTADDSILDAILNEQYGAAFDTVDAARARGQLSQGAFDNTIRGLEQKRAGAQSKLTDFGNTVLNNYRNLMDNTAKQYNDRITNYKLGQDFSFDDMTNALNSQKDTFNQRMKGDIYNALGDTALFNTDNLMARGNSAAGVSNNPLRNAFQDKNKNNSDAEDKRSNGTTGVF